MKILPLFVVAVSFISLTGSLELEIFPSPLEISANEDALLMCKFDQPEFDLTHIAVRWAFNSQTNQRDVYIFDGGNHAPQRTGAKMFDDDLRKGNASLYLPNVQFNEAGTYTCIVFVTPHKEQISSVMQVSVQPKVSISRLKITTANGTEHFLACDVKEFYPEKVNISWLTLSNGKMEYASKNQFTEDLVRNSDDTFSVSSKIRIEPTLDNRIKYRCVVKHKTFLGNFTLDADQVEEPVPKGAIIGGICGFVVFCAACFGLYFWIKKHKASSKREERADDSDRPLLSLKREQSKLKESEDDSGRAVEKTICHVEREPAKISLIKTPFEINEGEESKLDWDVTVFSPEVVNIVIWVKRKGKQEAKILFHWELPGSKLSGPKKVTIPLNDASDLCEKDDSFSAEAPELQRMDSRSIRISCSITLCPDISKDDGAEILIEVKQDTSEKTSTESTVLKVKAEQSKLKESEDDSGRAVEKTICHVEREPAKISLIQTPFEINEGEESKLDWDVTVFSPEVVNIVIRVKRKGKQEAKILFHWELPGSKLSGPKKVIIPLNDASDLCEKDDSFSAEAPELQRMDSRSIRISCSITLCPDISKDDGAEILIEVKQDTSEKTSTESTVLKVKAEQSKLKESEDDSGRAVEKTICHVEREPAKISLIQTPFEINEGEESKLDWDVTVFSPEVVNIVIRVKRKGKHEAKILFHWELPASKLSGPKKVTIPLNDASDLCEKDDSFSAEAPELQRMDSRSIRISCSITLCPDISKDDGAEILIEVKQDTSEKTSTESTVLKVKAEPAKISLIQTPFEINEGEESKLDWDVTVFSPEVVNIVIRVKRKGKQEAKILFHWKLPASKFSGPKKVIIPLNDASDLCEKDDSFSAEAPELQRMDSGSIRISCSITLCPDISKDDGAEILIEVKQDTSENTSTESTVLKVKADNFCILY
ncbi:uncharacterized protein [Scyliorhinus torazame]|uniref:uncharacterized protein isoform X2 n=1 Tax=Scyliorhinus torazame TaxID=75743 RepID=UPI003B5B69BD